MGRVHGYLSQAEQGSDPALHHVGGSKQDPQTVKQVHELPR